jgi:hypothetical protein
MNKITIKEASKEVTAWNKEITFEREGESYIITLYWDLYRGYDITFHNKTSSTPEWAIMWEENNSDSLGYTLDELTEKEEVNA